MNRLLVVVSLAVFSSIFFVGSVYANGGPHGGYGADLFTGACAGCHRAHTALGSYLIVKATQYELCMSCHGIGGAASTNVQIGRNTGTLVRLNGGGFESVTHGSVGQQVTSAHTVEGLPISGGGRETGVAKAWGSDGGDGTGVQGVLQCGSCHNPHGSTNYRMLRDSDNNGRSPMESRWVPDNPYILDWTDETMIPDGSPQAVLAGQPFTAYSTDDIRGVIRLNPGGPTSEYGTSFGNYLMGMSRFCATCHRQYWTMTGSARVDSMSTTAYVYTGTETWAGDTAGNVARYRHTVSMAYSQPTSNPLRFSADSWTDSATYTRQGMTCLTCHFAHGTSATASGFSTTAPSGDSALLYYPERGVCRSCHMQNK